jgi:hypothetical protein
MFQIASPTPIPASNGISYSPLEDEAKKRIVSLNASNMLPKLKTILSMTLLGYYSFP